MLKTERPHLFEIKAPSYVHDFAPGTQKRSGDQKIIVDRMPSADYRYTYGIYLQRYEKTIVWTHSEVIAYVKSTTQPKAGAIAGVDQNGQKLVYELNENEAIGLLAVMAAWINQTHT